MEVLWSSLLINRIKINTDGALASVSDMAVCGGIFRDHLISHVGNFACFLGMTNAVFAELMGAILAMEQAFLKNWSHLWLETNSKLVVEAFSNPSLVP